MICSARAMIVEARRMPSYETIWSITRWRSVFERATIRQSRSLEPVMVCASSTSGIAARCAATRSCPSRWLISRVTKLVTPNPIAAGEISGPKPEMTPRSTSLSSRACTVPRATPRRREHSSTPIRGSSASSSINRASRASSCTP